MLQERPNTPTNTDGNEVINKGTQQGYLVSDGTNNRVLVGFQRDGFGDGKDYGIKVSQEGFDVNSASEDELVMSSGFNNFKIIQSGTTTIPSFTLASGASDNRTVRVTLNEPQDSPPTVFAFATTGLDIYFPFSGIQVHTIGATAGSGVILYVLTLYRLFITTTYVDFFISFYNGSSGSATSEAYTIKYFILKESVT